MCQTAEDLVNNSFRFAFVVSGLTSRVEAVLPNESDPTLATWEPGSISSLCSSAHGERDKALLS